MSTVNDPIKWGARLFVYAAVLLAGYIASAVYADIRIRRISTQFCYQIQVGDNVDLVEQHALKLGASALEPRWVFQVEDKTLKLDLFFAGLPPFDGYICSLYMKEDFLARKEFSESE